MLTAIAMLVTALSSPANAAVCEDFEGFTVGFAFAPAGGSTVWSDGGWKLEYKDTGWVPGVGAPGLIIDKYPWAKTLQWGNGMEIESQGDDVHVVLFDLAVTSGTAAKVETHDASGAGLTSTIYPPGIHQVLIQSDVPIATIVFYDGDNETWIDNFCIIE